MPDTALQPTAEDAGLSHTLAPTPSGSRPWIAVATKPQAEHYARHCIERQGFHAYLPLLATPRRSLVPLFPGYLFVQLDPAHDPWRPINYTPGVYKIISDATGKPNVARKGAVEALQAGEAQRRTISPPSAQWSPGNACRLVRGPLRGLSAVVNQVINPNTATLTVMMLGELRQLAAPLANLAPCEDQP